MSEHQKYDVIIVGGGPAGLSVGSELARQLKVLVIEKGQVGRTTKSWFCPQDIIEKNPDIIPFTSGGVTRFLTNTFTGTPLAWQARQFDRYPYVHEREILLYWKDQILQNHSDIMENCLYLDHLVTAEGVIVQTMKGSFEGKLLIDASGSDSLILQKYEIAQPDYYWWSVYGAVATHPGGVRNMLVGDYMLWQTFADTNADPKASLRKGRPVFEYEILDDQTSFTLILYLQKNRVPLDFMQQQFEHIIRNESSTQDFHDIEVLEYKYGWYPSGGLLPEIARNRVDFIGDAGGWTTPCGWGMSYILNNYKHYAEKLTKLVKENRLDPQSLSQLIEQHSYDKEQILLDQLIVHFLSNSRADQLDKFIDLFREVDPLICEKIFTLKVKVDELKQVGKAALRKFSVEELVKIIPTEDYKYLVELGACSFGDLIKLLFSRTLKGNKLATEPLGVGMKG